MKKLYPITLALLVALAPLMACQPKQPSPEADTEIIAPLPDIPSVDNPNISEPPTSVPSDTPSETPPSEAPPTPPTDQTPPSDPPQPTQQKITYIQPTASSVNLRSGAGTNYAVLFTAPQDSYFISMGRTGDWYKTYFRNKICYISAKYCRTLTMTAGSQRVEQVITQGAKLLGTPYVYGAVRYHDGTGYKLKNFTTSAFDCSSLMQYIFYQTDGTLLQVTTRTQVGQGKAVAKANIQRGDLLFFTNASRVNKTGIERVGHVALYLGDNYILHTASDYAKIEEVTPQRWSYYICARRM